MEKNSVNNKIIHSFREMDLSAIAIPSIAIYKHRGIYRINMLRESMLAAVRRTLSCWQIPQKS